MRKAVKTTSTNTASKTEWIKDKSAEWSEKEAHHSPLSQVTAHKKQIIWSQKKHTVLNNVGNTANKWAAETSSFNRKYEQDPTQRGVYKPKGGPMNAAQINEPISFTAPWGEKMNIDKGDIFYRTLITPMTYTESAARTLTQPIGLMRIEIILI